MPFKMTPVPARRRTKDFHTQCREVTAEEALTPSEVTRAIIHRDRILPAWRWDHALFIRANNPNLETVPPAVTDDDYLRSKVLPFIFRVNDPKERRVTPADLRKDFPHLSWARDLHVEDTNERWRLEALVVGRMERGKLAQAFFTTTGCIEAYEKAFFDVRDRLGNTDYMWANIFRPTLQVAGVYRPEAFLWKAIAYAYGAEALQGYLDYFAEQDGDLKAGIARSIDGKILEDALSAVRGRDINRFNEQFVVEQYHKMRELENLVMDEGTRKQEMNLNVLIQSLSGSMRLASIHDPKPAVETQVDEEMAKVFQARLAQAPIEREKAIKKSKDE